MEALLGLFACVSGGALHAAPAHVANSIVAQDNQKSSIVCGWLGVQVRPMTADFAASLGMPEPYGAIFDRPEPGSPAASAGIEEGDVLTAVNGSPLARASDFARIISNMSPGSQVYLSTSRNGEAMEQRLVLGSAQCRTNGGAAVGRGALS
jgi:serine protease Do